MRLRENVTQNLALWLRALVGAPLLFRVVNWLLAVTVWNRELYWGLGWSHGFSVVLSDFSYFLAGLAPEILLLVYLFRCFPAKKRHPLLVVSYGLSALLALTAAIRSVTVFVKMFEFIDKSVPYLLNYWVGFFTNPVQVGFGAALAYFAATGFRRAKAAQILVGVQAAISLTTRCRLFPALLLHPGNPQNWFNLASLLASLATLTAHFLFWRYGATFTPAQTIQQKLYTLKQKAESGAISEQEYAAQKAELLRKL